MDLPNVPTVSLESGVLFLVFVGFLVAIRRAVDYRAAVVGIQYVSCTFRFSMVFSIRTNSMLIRNHPGYRIFISPASILGSIVPRIKGFALGGNFGFDEKHERGCPVTFGRFIV
jgi:hypothetical protein